MLLRKNKKEEEKKKKKLDEEGETDDETESSLATADTDPIDDDDSYIPNEEGFENPEQDKHTYSNTVSSMTGPTEYKAHNHEINELLGFDDNHMSDDLINASVRGQIQEHKKMQAKSMLVNQENNKIEEAHRKLKNDMQSQKDAKDLNLSNNFRATENILQKRQLTQRLAKDDKRELAEILAKSKDANNNNKMAMEFLSKKIAKQRKEIEKQGVILKPAASDGKLKEKPKEKEKLDVIEEGLKTNKISPKEAAELNKLRGVNKQTLKKEIDSKVKGKKHKTAYKEQMLKNKKLAEKNR